MPQCTQVYIHVHMLWSQTKHELKSLPYHCLEGRLWKIFHLWKLLDVVFRAPQVWPWSPFPSSPSITFLQQLLQALPQTPRAGWYRVFTLAGTPVPSHLLSSNSHFTSPSPVQHFCPSDVISTRFSLHSSCWCYLCYLLTKNKLLEGRACGSRILYFLLWLPHGIFNAKDVH